MLYRARWWGFESEVNTQSGLLRRRPSMFVKLHMGELDLVDVKYLDLCSTTGTVVQMHQPLIL